MTKRFQSLRSDNAGGTHPELERKADICTKVLAEARRLSRMGHFGAPLGQLIVRATEVLDDMDEILVVLSPRRDAPSFAVAARLHRELEYIQAAIADQRRHVVSSAKAGSTRN